MLPEHETNVVDLIVDYVNQAGERVTTQLQLVVPSDWDFGRRSHTKMLIGARLPEIPIKIVSYSRVFGSPAAKEVHRDD